MYQQMSSKRTGVLLLATLALVVAAVGGSTALAATSTQSTVTRQPSLEALVLRQVNAVRAAHGVGALAASADLSRSAVAHSRAMATYGFFSHDSRSGASFSQRIKRFYVPRSNAWSVGENLAMFGGATPTAAAIVDAWMGSTGHRENLLRGSFREAGIAIVFNPVAGGVFGGESAWLVTLDFGTR